MSTSMSSGTIIARELGNCEDHRFLSIRVWACESQFPIPAAFISTRRNRLVSKLKRNYYEKQVKKLNVSKPPSHARHRTRIFSCNAFGQLHCVPMVAHFLSNMASRAREPIRSRARGGGYVVVPIGRRNCFLVGPEADQAGWPGGQLLPGVPVRGSV